ncbi:MAG: hypothetical protein HZY79_01990 [Rhodoblastus sp.]|nr:MAG: hypothetical protein HZY79_01990 [Rhodoblastus sp.]
MQKRAGRRRPARREIARSETSGANRRRPMGVVDAIGRHDETGNRDASETPIFDLLIAPEDEPSDERFDGPSDKRADGDARWARRNEFSFLSNVGRQKTPRARA